MSAWVHYRDRFGEPDDLTRARIERAVLAAADRPAAPRRRFGVAAAVLLAAVLLVTVLALLPGGGAPEPAWVAITTSSRAQEVALPHGGALRVGVDTRIDLAASDEAGAVVRLHAGEVRLDVHSGDGIQWRVEVDAYVVEALGTRFIVRRTGDVPDVEVEEGIVRLTGPGQPRDGLLIRAVDPVVADRTTGGSGAAAGRPDEAARNGAAANGDAAGAAEPSAASQHQHDVLAERPAGPEGATAEDPAADDGSPEPPDSGDGAGRPAHALDGTAGAPGNAAVGGSADDAPKGRHGAGRWAARFRSAIKAGDDARAVEALPPGFPTGREGLRASDYLDAGDALASEGDRKRAEAAYRAACRRSNGASACGVATFRRALMASRRGDTNAAIKLATQYLDAHPRGSLAREVLGRRMRWNSVHGHPKAARADARAYLDRWPNGPHAQLARRLVTGE